MSVARLLPTLFALLACGSAGGLLAEDGASSGTSPAAEDPNGAIHAGTEEIEVEGEGAVAGGAPTSFVTVIRPGERPGTIASLADLLGPSVGVRVRSWGGLHSFATVSIRGSTPEQVVVLLDGIPLNSPMGGGVNLADLPLSGVEAIEVHRGFAPASIGVSSIGGAVNIKTRRPGDGGALHGSLAYGSWGTAEATALATMQSGPMRWVLSAEGSTTRGDFDYLDNNGTLQTSADDDFTRRLNNASRSGAVRAQGQSSLGDGRTLTLAAEWVGRRQGVPLIDAYQSETATFDASPRALLRGEVAWTDLANGFAEARVGLDGEYASTTFQDLGDPIGLQDTSTRIQAAGATLGVTLKSLPGQRVSFLVQPRAEAASVVDRTPTQVSDPVDPFHAHRATFAAVVEDEIHLASDRLLISPSLRLDAVRTAGRGGGPTGPTEPADDPAAFSGRVGALWALSSRWSVRGNVGRSYRIPSLLELYGNSGTLVGNPELVPEEGVNADLGLAFSDRALGPFRDVEVEVAGFRSVTDELIHFRMTSTRQFKATNVGEARITGLEATVSLRLFDRLALSGNLTIQRPEDTNDSFARGHDLSGVPRREAATSAALDLRPVTLFHRLSYVGENYIDDLGDANDNLPPSRQEQTLLPSRYLHDAGVRLALGSRATATLEALNLFDRHVVDVARYPLPGRTIFFKLEASF